MKISMPKGIMVDLDDTILANEVYKAQCWRTVASEYSDQLKNTARFIAKVEKASEWFWSDPLRHKQWRQDLRGARRRIVLMALKGVGNPDPQLAYSISESFSDLRDKEMRPFPGALETLQFLRESDIRLALVTNGSSESQRAKIDRFGLERYFEFIYIEGEQGAGKPEEAVYRKTMDALRTLPEETWMIGDKLEWEVVAPQKIGIKGIYINSRGEKTGPYQEVPFLTLSTLSDLLNYVR